MMHWHIVCDFDGTISRTDAIDNILERFADPSWEAIEQEWLDGHIGSRECLSRQLALVKATPAQLLAYFDTIDIDPDFPDFVDHVTSLGATIEVVSDGIEQGIARILSRNYVTLIPILANRLRQVDQTSWRIDFPYSSDACRAASGNCKCKSTPKGKRVLVIGDGQSDMCVASTADFVFAKDRLADHCERNGIPHKRFESFAELPALLALLPSSEAANATAFALDSAENSSQTQELFHHV
ncbi:MtnX-like HAD-IB family phosphatase [Pseudomonas fuscovaginae UPB0736]|uniref:Haloacid Dehalogenase superfamily, subfamily IB, phosphoserine phosphatase-like/2,3-diketo-5-methylthio-1-phosphopentane phosphatase n=1 Tax=Pseudomonas asplenii TaxID=53407 RepID=A0A1H6MVV7_9PSED|nr:MULTISPECIES: MtnX-like HAD-IB family phosphatase [Pseudomonas]UUQ63389.1 MtnX-like HAD-IB family phosphatase [Pseudomonas fuscovaginae UPB0736]UZE28113.1 MtnX-like HAD-IB family phosphatase [Pseudomonas asplenii]SDS74583.1 Haloacid Dehalogenase superfamily, subfamily IB, phosphoserine phosphatase-like/2,3-diketo-5-methylthio-1-phosphopentane phosphatase [Pseudomonas asplenii]SEI06310.1 Haloacid Dehalogenase superfamily, subfamily IB, phosphoserine phosphatase-like/2,3-diketo-5-methylthio-1-